MDLDRRWVKTIHILQQHDNFLRSNWEFSHICWVWNNSTSIKIVFYYLKLRSFSFIILHLAKSGFHSQPWSSLLQFQNSLLPTRTFVFPQVFNLPLKRNDIPSSPINHERDKVRENLIDMRISRYRVVGIIWPGEDVRHPHGFQRRIVGDTFSRSLRSACLALLRRRPSFVEEQRLHRAWFNCTAILWTSPTTSQRNVTCSLSLGAAWLPLLLP